MGVARGESQMNKISVPTIATRGIGMSEASASGLQKLLVFFVLATGFPDERDARQSGNLSDLRVNFDFILTEIEA